MVEYELKLKLFFYTWSYPTLPKRWRLSTSLYALNDFHFLSDQKFCLKYFFLLHLHFFFFCCQHFQVKQNIFTTKSNLLLECRTKKKERIIIEIQFMKRTDLNRFEPSFVPTKNHKSLHSIPTLFITFNSFLSKKSSSSSISFIRLYQRCMAVLLCAYF